LRRVATRCAWLMAWVDGPLSSPFLTHPVTHGRHDSRGCRWSTSARAATEHLRKIFDEENCPRQLFGNSESLEPGAARRCRRVEMAGIDLETTPFADPTLTKLHVVTEAAKKLLRHRVRARAVNFHKPGTRIPYGGA
jgi:hypothetical protein